MHAGGVHPQVAQRMEARLCRQGLDPSQRATATPQPEDFDPDLASKGDISGGADPAGIFSDLVGCQEVLARLQEWQATISACQALGKDPLESMELNFLFVGAPGGLRQGRDGGVVERDTC